MELSTDLLANVTFREQWRGYSPDQVDEFLERLGVAITELQERARVAEQRAAEAESASNQDEIRRTLVLAQRTASAAVDEAREDASRILAEAETVASERMRDAEQVATGRLAEAEAIAADADSMATTRLTEVDEAVTARLAEVESAVNARLMEADAGAAARLAEAAEAATARVADAQATAAALLAAAESTGAERRASAETRLAQLEAEVARREREDLEALNQRQAALSAEVEAMQAFLQEGRARLRAELQAQVAVLDASAGDVPPWVGRLHPGPSVQAPTAAMTAAPSAPSAVESPSGFLFDRAIEDPTGDLIGLPLEPGRSDPVLARARADLADALREAGVLLEPGVDRAPEPRRATDDEEPLEAAPAGEAAVEDSGEAVEPSGESVEHESVDHESVDHESVDHESVDHMEWRSVSIPDEPDDDPFLAELRRAVTDTEPLGPREHEPTQEHRAFEGPEPGRFRIRRNRG
jgi:DivIVA domain-containing protein